MTDASSLVFIIVLNWNSYEDTTRCIRSLEALDYPHFSIVIVDNASQDGSESILRNRFPQYRFIQTGKNWGYGGGNNFGIRHALKEGADYVWIVNPDVVVTKDSLKGLIEVIEKDSSIGIAGPRLIWKTKNGAVIVDGFSVWPEKGFKIRPNLVDEGIEKKNGLHEGPKEMHGVLGCSMLVRREVFLDVGLIRDDFFMFHEEAEFNLRARGRGWQAVICPEVRNEHFWKEEGKLQLASFYFPRNTLFIARLQNRYFFQTMVRYFDLRRSLNLIKKRQFKELLWHLTALWEGAFLLLKSTPPVYQE